MKRRREDEEKGVVHDQENLSIPDINRDTGEAI
jgi:hypothetical protein